ncbi:MAG: hypothetical protein GEU91_16305 [Rhizobiales bacterium]|nr:hypothetical protein [Hyphomicrobiales bacterium]
MPQAKTQATRRSAQDSPELLISFLQYALDDVRALSERSGRHLELAIATLAEDTSVIDVAAAVSNLRSRS